MATHLRCLDWVARHRYWSHLKLQAQLRGKLRAVEHVVELMGPDELLEGENTGLPSGELIPLGDLPRRPRKRSTQLTLHHFWPMKKKRRWIQTTIRHYF